MCRKLVTIRLFPVLVDTHSTHSNALLSFTRRLTWTKIECSKKTESAFISLINLLWTTSNKHEETTSTTVSPFQNTTMVFVKSSIVSAFVCVVAALATTSSAEEIRRLGAPRELQGLAPLTELDTEAYLGRWYQTYASRGVKYTFELGGNCVTADYGAIEGDPKKISVTNTVRPSGFLGWFTDAIVVEGFAAQSDTVLGQLEVNLPAGPFGGEIDINDVTYEHPGNYWILELGPFNAEGKYSWSIVTNNSEGGQLYILVRDVADFEANHEAEVLAKVEAYGFTRGGNRPRKTNQKNCDYSV